MDLSCVRKESGISRATDLVSASTRKYSSSMPNLYSSDMVYLSRANVVSGNRAPLQRTSLELREIPAAVRRKRAGIAPIPRRHWAKSNAAELFWFHRHECAEGLNLDAQRP